MALTKAQARKIAASFPSAYEKPSYGTPAFFVGKKLFVQVGSHKREAIMLLTQSFEERNNFSPPIRARSTSPTTSRITKASWRT